MNLVKLRDNLNVSIVNHIYEYNNPRYIYVPITTNQTLRRNDYVNKNSYFDNSVISVSGSIISAKSFSLNNKTINTIKIENDYKENTVKKAKKVKINNLKDLLVILDNFKLFKIKNKIEKLRSINNLIVSAIDEEYYSASQCARLSNNYEEILEMIDVLNNILKIDGSILAIKNDNLDNIKNVNSEIGQYPNIKIGLLPNLYLIGRKENLCEYFGYHEEKTLVLNVLELYNLFLVYKYNIDITESLITISGECLDKSLIIKVRLYTSLKEILEEFYQKNMSGKVHVNGLLQGYEEDIENVIITPDIHTIVLESTNNLIEDKCINCGACKKICPYKINVKKCYFNNSSNVRCIGCGLCDYICPANIKLKKVVKGNNDEEI